MSLISDNKINEIVASSNIVDIIGEYVDLKRSGSSFKGLCPFHNEKTPSFTVDDKKQLFHCFGCGAGGDVVSFIMQKEGLSYPEALKYLAQKSGITIDYTEDPGINKRLNTLYQMNKDIAMYYYKNLLVDKKAQTYLLNRGLKSRLVNTFFLGYAKNSWDDLINFAKSKDFKMEDLEEVGLIKKNKHGNYYDKYRDRIIFPIINHFGKVIGFGGRSISDGIPKYLNSSESSVFKKRYNLYGLNVYKKQKDRRLILVEGYMDVIALNNHGIDLAVASLGTALTKDQARLISRYADDIYICYDGDEAGIKASKRAIDVFLDLDINPNIIKLEDGLDPDDFIKTRGKDEFLGKMEDAQDAYSYLYNEILDEYANASQNKKLDKLDLFIEFLAKIKKDLSREIYINNISQLFQIDKATLKGAINKYNKTTNINNKDKFLNKENKKVIVKPARADFNTNELEVLRLFFNQRSDYEKNRDFFDKAITNKKIEDVRTFLKEKDPSKFDLNDKDYKYILDYIRDKKNPILADELKDKIELFNKKEELKKLKNK